MYSWSNCLFFVIGRWVTRGGYVVVKQSEYWPGPHFIWSPDLTTFEHFIPDTRRRRWFPPIVFKGRVQEYK
jgi:hypothetical protein